MEHPIRVAFCKLLFAKNGGEFDDRGLPRFRRGVRGRCDRAWDCADCAVMQEWLAALHGQGWIQGWECDDCLRATREEEKGRADLERHVQGFYQSGRRPDHQPDDREYDQDQPSLSGCTKCGKETSFLQLVLRRQR